MQRLLCYLLTKKDFARVTSLNNQVKNSYTFAIMICQSNLSFTDRPCDLHMTESRFILLRWSSSTQNTIWLFGTILLFNVKVVMHFLDPLLILHYASTSFTEIFFSDTNFRQLSQMLLSLIFFHTSEYILAIVIHGASNVTLSSLLITKHYALAMLMALLEYLTETTLFPKLKQQHMWVSNFGLIMIITGETIRKTAIITAGRSFTHLIKTNHEEHHRLVTHGVYRLMRHPSYCGFLIWSVGTQIMLCNPVSTVLFTVVVWRFFTRRILYEEGFLKQFFGVEYVVYAESVASGIPFVL